MELKEIDTSNSFNADSYPDSGIFHNLFDGNVIYVNKSNNLTFIIDTFDEFSRAIDTKPKELNKPKEGQVSESFALKMLAIQNGMVDNIKL